MLPMLPRHPMLLGGIIAPVLWTGVLHSALPLINPFLAERIDWGWFVVSQVTFGLVAGWVVSQQSRHPHRAISALCRPHGLGNAGDDGRAPSGGRTEVMARLLLHAGLLSRLCWAAASFPGIPSPGRRCRVRMRCWTLLLFTAQNCSACHGAQGMNGPSYPLANPAYQALVDEQVLHQIVANGEPGTLMPAFAISAGGSLTDQQVDALVQRYARCLVQAGDSRGREPAALSRPPKAADAAHGQQVYATYCASCHGAAGQTGKSKAGSITEPAFLSLVSDQALRTIVIAGRPDIGQPDWRNDLPGHPMSDQEVTDVVGWLSSQRPGTQKKPRGGSQ